MRWSDIPFRPSDSTLRQFAGLSLAVFGGLALWRWLGHGETLAGAVLGAFGLGIGLVGLIRPRSIRPVFVGWMVAVFPIGWLVSLVLLVLVYYGMFVPLGLVFRLIGRDALLLRPGPEPTTYWLPKPAPGDVRQYFRQF